MGHIYLVKNVSIVVNLLTYAASEKDTSGPVVNYFQHTICSFFDPNNSGILKRLTVHCLRFSTVD